MSTPDMHKKLAEEFGHLNITTPDLSKSNSYQNILDNVITPNPSQFQSPRGNIGTIEQQQKIKKQSLPQFPAQSAAQPNNKQQTVAQRSNRSDAPPPPQLWTYMPVELASSPADSMPNMVQMTFSVPQAMQSGANNPMPIPPSQPMQSQPQQGQQYYSPQVPYPFPYTSTPNYSYSQPQFYGQAPQYYSTPSFPQVTPAPIPPVRRDVKKYNRPNYRYQRKQSYNHRNNSQQHRQQNNNGRGSRQYIRESFRDKYEAEMSSISELVNNETICDVMVTQDGSRYIQNHFSELSAGERGELLTQVLKNDIISLSRHVFSNWVIQLIYEYSTFDQCKQIIRALSGQIYNLTINTFGCRLIQKILCSENDKNNVILKEMVCAELSNKTLECLRNNNGHHVIEKCLSHCPVRISGFILQEIVPQLMSLAIDPFGCQIIELVLKKFTFSHRDVNELLKRITANISEMSRHRYGNYIVQDVIESAPLAMQDKMFKAIFADIVELGCNKYSSNVVEKSIYLASNKRRRKLVRKIVDDDILNKKKFDIGSDEEEDDHGGEEEKQVQPQGQAMHLRSQHTILRKLIYDKFGNYVIQTLLICSGRKDREKLMNFINTTFPDLAVTPYGKHIMAAMEKVQRQHAAN